MKNLILLCVCFLMLSPVFAGFHCPEDVTINCDMDIHNTDMTGYPNTTGFNVGLPITYTDLNLTNGCGVGQVNRTWYQDLNNNQILESDEPSCTQVITVSYLENGLFDINWPPNRNLSCIDDISFEAPEIVHGPCDLVGYVYEDQIFELTNEACYKVLRTFSVINWCTYNENNPSLGGIYNYTQVIKVIEKELPEFISCEDITIAMDEGCQANVTITSAAEDTGDCPSEELYWTVEIDLGWDLVIDYEYSYLLSGDRYLAPTANGEALSITLSDLVDGGTHGAYYTVKDGCGNVRSCEQRIYVEDQKAPTPYCHAFLNASFDADAMPAMIPAELFNLGATDNCTETEDIRISFSSDPDDNIKEINCGSQGFQFFNIYATDEAGNADFCQVFMLIFDNDGCSFRYAPEGTIIDVRGQSMEGVNVYLTDGVDAMYETVSANLGEFKFEPTELVSDYYLMTDVSQESIIQPSILELKRMQDHIIGKSSFQSPYQYVAADINRDKSFNASDIIALRDHLIGIHRLENEAFSIYIEAESIDESWNDYDDILNYMDYDGSFDLLHVGLSDLITENGSLKQNIIIDQNVTDGRTMLSITSGSNMNVDGVEITLELPRGLAKEDITLYSDVIDINTNEYHYDTETGSLKLATLKSFTITEHEPYITISIGAVNLAIIEDINVDVVSNNQLIKSAVINKSSESEGAIPEDYALITTTVVEDYVLINNNISLGQINIYDMQGRIVNKAINNNNRIDVSALSQGLYILQWTDGEVSRQEKFVKR